MIRPPANHDPAMLVIILGVVGVVAAVCIGSMIHVYAFRGNLRFDGWTEYVRKGWPMFAPLNCALYSFTQRRARRAIMDPQAFPELDLLRDHWQVIRDEALALHRKGTFDAVKAPDGQAYYDIGFRTFYKYGWSKFYLKWYGYTHRSALAECPQTVAILKKVKAVNGAMFSILPPGSKLTRHLDPVACSLRYHLGLSTPNDDACYINIDGTTYSWRDGEVLMFDETYLHFAFNNSDQHRLILMCDVERPMHLPGRIINWFNKIALRMSVVPNAPGDRRGLANLLFSTLAPVLKRTKALKERNRPLYLLIKHSVNLTLILLALALLGLAAWSVLALFRHLTA